MDIELFNAARQGDSNKLQQIIDENPHFLKGKTPRQNTVLHIASRLGHIRFAESISTECPLLLVAQNCKGDTAVHLAARAGLSDVVVRLIECAEREDSKEEMLTMVNGEQSTALHEAARNSHERVVDLLLNHQPNLVYAINKDGASAFYMAAYGGCLQSVRRIFEEVDRLDEEETREDACRGPGNCTPLHAAVMLQRLDIVEELMAVRKVFARRMDAHGSYPLHYASAHCDKEMMEANKYGARFHAYGEEMMDNGNRWGLFLAYAFHVLAKEMMEPTTRWAPCYASAPCGNAKMVEMILQSDTSVAYLKNRDGQLPLHVAVRNGCIHVIEQFKQFCPDSYEAIDDRGWNALHFAVESKKVEAVRHILNSNELGELTNEPNDEGNTPLHLAITNYNLSIFGLLIKDQRLDVNVMNRKGQTALDIAESDKDLLNHKLRKFNICNDLRIAGGKRGLHSIDKADKKRQYDSHKDMVNILLVVAGLIITISFAAALTVPGGFNSKGKPTLGREYILRWFIITDAISLFTSICVALMLFLTAVGDHSFRILPIYISLQVIVISLGSLTLSFVFVLWLVLSKEIALVFLSILCVVFALAFVMPFLFKE